MGESAFYRYLWFFNTLGRNNRITRAEIDRLWRQSEWSGGMPMSRRTFANYREKTEVLFDINIAYDAATYEYYIESDGAGAAGSMRQWIYDLLSVNHLLQEGVSVASRVLPEQIPSGYDYLETLVAAMQAGRVVRFSYHAFWNAEAKAVELEPYFVKAFRRRWYVVGLNRPEQKIKTYALDRILDISMTADEYLYPAGFDAARYFHDSFGVMRGDEVPQKIVLRVSSRQAQYFRALPLHHSQQELETHDGVVTFRYNMYVTYDLIQELLSLGREVTVVEPVGLRNEMVARLQAALDGYRPIER